MLDITLVLLSAFVSTNGQVFNLGKCPTSVTTQSTLDVKQYMGVWYEILKYPTSFEDNQKCITANYTLLDNGHISIVNSAIGKDGQPTRAQGDAFCPDPKEPTKLDVRFTSGSPYAKYWILDTDYKTYSLIYSCTNLIDVSHIEFVWILSRERTLSEDIKKKLKDEMTNFKINIDPLINADQEGCTS